MNIQVLEDIRKDLKTITDFFYYLFHPAQILMLIWHWTLSISYWVCLFIALFALICYVFNIKKFAKLVPFSVGFYALLQAIGSAFR